METMADLLNQQQPHSHAAHHSQRREREEASGWQREDAGPGQHGRQSFNDLMLDSPSGAPKMTCSFGPLLPSWARRLLRFSLLLGSRLRPTARGPPLLNKLKIVFGITYALPIRPAGKAP